MLGFAPAGVARHRPRGRLGQTGNWRTTHVRQPPRQELCVFIQTTARAARLIPHPRQLRLFSSRYLLICGVSLFSKLGRSLGSSAPLREKSAETTSRLAAVRLSVASLILRMPMPRNCAPGGIFCQMFAPRRQEGFVPKTGRSRRRNIPSTATDHAAHRRRADEALSVWESQLRPALEYRSSRASAASFGSRRWESHVARERMRLVLILVILGGAALSTETRPRTSSAAY